MLVTPYFVFRVDIKNRRNRTAAEVAHNVQISNTILESYKKSTHLDYFDTPTTEQFVNEERKSVSGHHSKHEKSRYDADTLSRAKVIGTDHNAGSTKMEAKVEEGKREINLLFKAIKMGDISFISDYFGVAIGTSKLDYFDGIEDFQRSTWYVQDEPDNNVIDDEPIINREDDSVNKNKPTKVLREMDVFGQEGSTPLHVASAAGSIEVVQFLLSVGASPHIRY